jgi:hypothetical protein
METEALTADLTSEKEVLAFHDAAKDLNKLTTEIIREAGLKVIQAAFSRVDILLSLAFRAQRSIESYLLIDQTQLVYYDVGRIHPDAEADYIRDADPANNNQTLKALADAHVTLYQTSFSRILNPTDMFETYNTYFKHLQLRKDIYRHSFSDPKDLETFRATFTLTFNFDAATLDEQRYSTKIQAIGIAFIGATGTGNIISCKIEHGAFYSERRSDGKTPETILKPRYDTILAPVTPLQTSGFDLDSSPPLDESQSSWLWGMGIGGLYTITIPESEFKLHHPTFDGLKEIEVWLGYQYL